MSKPMSNREMEIFKVALNYARRLSDCCPDVGMGPSLKTLAKEVSTKLSFSVSEDDICELCEMASGQ